MNLSTKTIMASVMAMAAVTSCSNADDEQIIEKPDLKIEDGRFTPEILCGLGKKRPRLHIIFHIFVLLGSIVHFAVIYKFVL